VLRAFPGDGGKSYGTYWYKEEFHGGTLFTLTVGKLDFMQRFLNVYHIKE